MKHLYLIILGLMFFNVINAQNVLQNKMRGPKLDNTQLSMEEYGSGKNFLLDIYQNYLSPVKGGNRCPMYPSCSQYAKILFEEKPLYQAYIYMFERILRCGHELYLYPKIISQDRALWYDPPITNKRIEKTLNVVRTNMGSDLFLSYNNAPNEDTRTSDSSFALYLFQEKEYYRAATEFMRLAFYLRDTSQKAYYYSKVGMCFYLGEDYEGYISFFEKNRDLFRKSELLYTRMNLILGKVYYHQKKYKKAISTFEWSNIHEDEQLFNELQYNMGLSYARLFEWEKAANCFSKINPKTPLGTSVKSLKDSILLGEYLTTRKPSLAGILSAVIPGAGYIYSDRTQTGIISFIVNGLFVWSVKDAIKSKNYGIASALGFFGIGWYIGNIVGSGKAAIDFNKKVRNDFIDKTIREYETTEF